MADRTVKSISLVHIKRVGWANWAGSTWWCARKVMVWSQEHQAWWRREGKGYTDDADQAWICDFITAFNHTEHCGPEKKISYFALAVQP